MRRLAVVCRVLRHSGWRGGPVALAHVADRMTVAIVQPQSLQLRVTLHSERDRAS